MDDDKKKVDEAWKEQIEKEKAQKDQPSAQQDGSELPEEADFRFFVTTLALQASIFLGAIPHPSTQKMEENLPQAKLLIDTLGMLKEKTQGNLTTEEDSLLENYLYELRMQYVAKIKGGSV